MSIQTDPNKQTLVAKGYCTVEDSEDLLRLLDETGWPVDVSELTHLHTACMQVLLMKNARLQGRSPVKPLQALLDQSLMQTHTHTQS